jgi:PleD family two-component response regulator
LGVSHAPTGRELSEAIKRADIGLYRAKNQGRNGVEFESVE